MATQENVKIKIATGSKSKLDTLTKDKGRIAYTKDTKELFIGNGDEFVAVNNQFSTMPTASADTENMIVQYIGKPTSLYNKGQFYQCVKSGDTYSWNLISHYRSTTNNFPNKGATLIYTEGTYSSYMLEVGGADGLRDLTVEELDDVNASTNNRIYTIKLSATGKVTMTDYGNQWGNLTTTIIIDTTYYQNNSCYYIDMFQELINLRGVKFTRSCPRTKIEKNLTEALKFRTYFTDYTFGSWYPDHIEFTDVWKAQSNVENIKWQRTVKSGRHIKSMVMLDCKDMATEGRKYLLAPSNLHGIKPPYTTTNNDWYPAIVVDGVAGQNAYHEEARLFINNGVGQVEMYQKAGGNATPTICVVIDWFEV